MEITYISINQASVKYGLKKSWFYERTRTKSIPFLKFGKYLRFRVDELEEWFENNCSLKSRIDGKRKP